MLIIKMTGILVLAVLMTLALLFALRLLGRLPNKLNKDSDSSYYGRCHTESEVYSHYITKYASRVPNWIRQTLHVKIRHPTDSSNHEGYKTASDGFVQTRHFITHIRTIVNKLRRGVNQSGKEPFKSSKI
jgi:uncharacterized membrane protein YhiD involved in acid resistance